MKIRSELANRLKAYADQRRETAAGRGTSFKETLESRNTGGVRTPQPSGRIAHGYNLARYEPPHHAIRRPAKEITLEQANRLARYAPVIQECSRKYQVPVPLICAVILQESGGNPKAVSPAGAKGLMQLMPQTARRFGVTNVFDPRQNIDGGTQYLRFLMDRFKGDYRLVLAGYNAGEHNVEKYGNKVPPFAETKNYVPSVLAYADTIHYILRTPVTVAALPPHAKKV